MLARSSIVSRILALSCFMLFRFAYAELPQAEVDALQQITSTMGATYWRFNNDGDNCQVEMVGLMRQAPEGSEGRVDCECSNGNNTGCHVGHNHDCCVLKGYSLPGVLPPELVKLPYLREIDFAYNYLNGTIPPEWASTRLSSISVLANRLSGEIPKELGNITTLTYLALEANQFSGTIPPELGNLINLETLMLSSNKLTGMLPTTFATLRNLTDFRINDNNFIGSIPDFIHNWKQLTRLEMLSSGLVGPIPLNISLLDQLTDLRISDINGSGQGFPTLSSITGIVRLDLSFNKLVGGISNQISARNLNFVFLTGNMLSGNIPVSVLKDGSSMKGIIPCMEDFRCPRYGCSLHVNSGGNDLTITESNRKVLYEGDAGVDGGSSRFFRSDNNWGFSSTGDFMDDDNVQNTRYIESVPSRNISELYSTARLSPLSLTYFHYCLENGNYTVSLHFAEIQFDNGRTFSSLGRRIFDIYIQESLVRKDFNIEDEAGGAQRPLEKQFNASVTNNILEIRFYWAGKGTTRIPSRGAYGPLVSAISVNPNFKTCSIHKGKNVTVYVIVGVVALCITVSMLIGLLPDGTVIAVKQLSSRSRQGNREFLNEIGMISCLQHPNLVKLHGCCIEGDQLMLVYEYMENNSLANALFGSANSHLTLDWHTRFKICIGIARGLAFLHEESRIKIVHRDIKATNVLLDRDLNPKISDFGLARLNEEDKTHVSTRVAGTIGYMAPEYALWGYLSDKADVYSFGVVALEIVSGNNNADYMPNDDCICLLDWACQLQKKGNLHDLVDQRLGSKVNIEEAERMVEVALLCTNASPSQRPIMSEVVSMLEGQVPIPNITSEGSTYTEDLRFKAMRDFHTDKYSQTMTSTTMQTDICSSSTPITTTTPLYEETHMDNIAFTMP
ncbi:hypothetical protein LguiB_033906 [Lonicera macranthoides]